MISEYLCPLFIILVIFAIDPVCVLKDVVFTIKLKNAFHVLNVVNLQAQVLGTILYILEVTIFQDIIENIMYLKIYQEFDLEL